MSDNQGSGNPQGQPQTGDPSGTGQAAVVPNDTGDKNDPGVFGEISPTVDYTKQATPESKTEGDKTPPATTPPVTTTVQQPSAKDDRHSQTKINTLVDEKINVAEKLLEKDADAIYEIASTDPSLAESLLKRHSEYGVQSVDDLLSKKELGDADLQGLAQQTQTTSKEVKELKADLMESRINEVKAKHPDLKGDLEQEFRQMYNKPEFKGYTAPQLYKVVKALHGKESQQSTANDVGLDILKQQEGATVQMTGASTPEKKSTLTPDQRRTMNEFGHSAKDHEDFLPENIDDILNQ